MIIGGNNMEMFFIVILFFMNIILYLMYKQCENDIENLVRIIKNIRKR